MDDATEQPGERPAPGAAVTGSAAPRHVVPVLSAVFFASGAAALVFESLWFRQAGLAFGNGLWASTLVLSSFMSGLALGNALVIRLGHRIRRPVRFYAGVECSIALAGLLAVLLLPGLGRWLAPLLGGLGEAPLLDHATRFLVSFAVLVVPATAMGVTLPVLVGALRRHDAGFGTVLGRLYGYNTLGAVLGALAAETILVDRLGVRGAGVAASLLYLSAAAVAAFVARAADRPAPRGAAVTREGERAPDRWRAVALAASAFLAGWIVLALEVVWFRFLRLFVHPSPLAFSVMLAVVLSGIGVGGRLAGLWLGRRPDADRHAATVAALAGALTLALYAGFDRVVAPFAAVYIRELGDLLWLSAALMAPVAIASGVIFTLTGTALRREVRDDVRATGALTLVNTIGGALGSIGGAFLLLPALGVERSVFALGVGYLAVTSLLLLAVRVEGPRRSAWAGAGLGLGVLGVAALTFPFGAMAERHLPLVAGRYGYPDHAAIEGFHEGRMQTVMVLRHPSAIEPDYHRLVTGGFSMASANVFDRRYMKLFVYLPIALAPDARDALLISYGVGSTAKALTDTATLARIDIVDIDRAVVETDRLVFADAAERPTADPRVSFHEEDGRYFLQTTARRYDLITSEPPPPKHAGVVNLYTREYFELVRDRLVEGGIASYWLPVHLLTYDETRGVVRAFCEAFPRCSLWGGFGYSWMLVGPRGELPRPDEDAFTRQWRDPVVRPELRRLALERPEQLGALFMADAPLLAERTAEALPLVDDRPRRLGDVEAGPEDFRRYREWMDPGAAARRFASSEEIARLWPPGQREAALPYFELQGLFDAHFSLNFPPDAIVDRIRAIHRIQRATPLETLVLWHLDDRDPDARAPDPLRRAGHALAARDHRAAAALYGRALAEAPRSRPLAELQLYAFCMAGGLVDSGVGPARCGRLVGQLPDPWRVDAPAGPS